MSSNVGNLEIDKMMHNPNLTVQIGIGRGAGTIAKDPYTYITGALIGDLGFNLANTWTSLVPLNSIPLASDIASGVGAVFGSLLGASQMSLESLYMTSASWKGCEIPKIPLQVAFVNYSPDKNCFKELLELSKGALPPDKSYNSAHAGKLSDIAEWPEKLANLAADKIEQTELIQDYETKQKLANTIKSMAKIGQEAPLGYGLEPGENEEDFFVPKKGTTFQVRIGSWFHAADPPLIMESINMQVSKETLPNGLPIYAIANLVFRPYRQISWIEFQRYFKGPKAITSQAISEESKVANAAMNSQSTGIIADKINSYIGELYPEFSTEPISLEDEKDSVKKLDELNTSYGVDITLPSEELYNHNLVKEAIEDAVGKIA